MENCFSLETWFHTKENVFMVKKKGHKLRCLRHWERTDTWRRSASSVRETGLPRTAEDETRDSPTVYCTHLCTWRNIFEGSNKIIDFKRDLSPYLENLAVRCLACIKTLNLERSRWILTLPSEPVLYQTRRWPVREPDLPWGSPSRLRSVNPMAAWDRCLCQTPGPAA